MTDPFLDRVVLAEAGLGPADGGGDDLDMDELGVVLIREVTPDVGVEFQHRQFAQNVVQSGIIQTGNLDLARTL